MRTSGIRRISTGIGRIRSPASHDDESSRSARVDAASLEQQRHDDDGGEDRWDQVLLAGVPPDRRRPTPRARPPRAAIAPRLVIRPSTSAVSAEQHEAEPGAEPERKAGHPGGRAAPT